MSTGQLGSATGYLAALFREGTLSSRSDSELLEQFITARSDRDNQAELAFSALLQRHGAMVLRACRSVLGDDHRAEDAFQATFLVLASRAKSIRRRISLASWLYGVALRVAGTERSRAARRKRHERRRAEMISESDTPAYDEAARALHEEIGLLPERYRSAVVLCYLEGLTHEAAALRLGRPVGTVHSRLATARERLRARLTRRGVEPAVFPAFSFSDGASTVVSAALEEATLRASVEILFGRAAFAGVVSAEAIALMEGTLRTLTITRWVVGLASVVAGAFITLGAGVLAYSSLVREEMTRPRRLGDAVAIEHAAGGQEKTARQASSLAPKLEPAQGQGGEAGGPAAKQGPIVIRAETVDGEGTHIPGVGLGFSLSYAPRRAPEFSKMQSIASDNEGKASVQFDRFLPGERVIYASVWAYKPGRSLATAGVPITGKSPREPVRLVLVEPVTRTITVVGPDGKPIEGLRLVPRSLRLGPTRIPATIPEDLDEELKVTTDAKGVATIPYLSRAMNMLTVWVYGPGIARHTLALAEEPGTVDHVLKLGGTGRLVGVVRSERGEPLHDVPLEVWVRATGDRPNNVGIPRGRRRATPTEVIPFNTDPPRTGPQGAFQTPSELLSGSTYRVSLRRDGFEPFVSDWVTLEGERTTVPAIRLRALRRLAGAVRDRQGQAVAGARVFLASRGPATSTDAQGRFELTGVSPEKTFLLVKSPGFRFQGWPVDPAATADAMSLSITRFTEQPERMITPVEDPLPAAERKALCKRLLEPYLHSVMERQNDLAKLQPLLSLIEFDPGRVRDILDKGQVQDPRTVANLRGELAVQSAGKDAGDAHAELTAIADPRFRVHFLVRLAGKLPKAEHGRARKLLEEAIVQARTLPEMPMKINILEQMIKGLLDLGVVEQAKPLIEEGLKLLDAQPTIRASLSGGLLAQVARIDPGQAFMRIQKVLDSAERDRLYGRSAVEMAVSQPPEAERFFGLMEERSGFTMYSTTIRLCRRLAKVDLVRARRIATAIDTAGTRACAWAFTALGVSENDEGVVDTSLDRSLEAIDQILESGPGPESMTNLDGIEALYPTNPAVVVLPVVEQVAPERLGEFFWRAVALHERIDPNREDALQRSGIGYECMLLSRYNREVASAFFQPMDSFIQSVLAHKGQSDELTASVIVAKACLDPNAAVELLESLPLSQEPISTVNEARMGVANLLWASPRERWMVLWRSMQAQLPLDYE